MPKNLPAAAQSQQCSSARFTTSIRGRIDCRQKIKPKSDRLLGRDYPIVGLSTEEDEITRTGRYLYDPKFYAVGPDDVVVRIDSDGREVRGTVMLTGFPYPPAKVFIEGSEISESEAMRLVNEARVAKKG